MKVAMRWMSAPVLLLGVGVLAGCGDDAPITNVTYSTTDTEATCQSATVKILQAADQTFDPAMDAAKVRSVVLNGAPACARFDSATLDRLYAAAATAYLADPASKVTPTPAPKAKTDPDAQARLKSADDEAAKK